MSLTKLLPVILLMMATGVQASTRDEIERLWNPQGMAVQPAQPAADTSARTEKPAPRWFRLSNGRQVNLADWKVVLFMQGHCPYCHSSTAFPFFPTPWMVRGILPFRKHYRCHRT